MAAPQRVGVGVAWLVGLGLDLLTFGLVGSHALTKTVIAFLVGRVALRLRAYPVWQQTAFILILLVVEHWGIEPDLMQFAKAITSGYFPLGGIGISDEIASVMNDSGSPWMHAYTYSSHPVGCAVALAMMDIIENENILEHVQLISQATHPNLNANQS